eukprot:1541089-Rhodomonas_salina.2
MSTAYGKCRGSRISLSNHSFSIIITIATTSRARGPRHGPRTCCPAGHGGGSGCGGPAARPGSSSMTPVISTGLAGRRPVVRYCTVRRPVLLKRKKKKNRDKNQPVAEQVTG